MVKSMINGISSLIPSNALDDEGLHNFTLDHTPIKVVKYFLFVFF